jgi:orotate phosphoribosyltransferase
VISAGTSVRESVGLIRAAHAMPAGVLIALDRMERGATELSATQEVGKLYDIPVISIATLDDLIGYLGNEQGMQAQLDCGCRLPKTVWST